MGSPWKALSDDNRRRIYVTAQREGNHHTY